MLRTVIPGYTYGQAEVAKSPYSMEELENIEKCVLFTDEDARYLKMAGKVLSDQIEQILDVWYGFVASMPFLVRHFSTPEGHPDEHYMAAVRARFGQWIIDTCNRHYDQDWLDYQHEIALRHAPEKKNKTDNVSSTPYIELRYIIGLIYPITVTIKPFLARRGHSQEDIERMHQAWFKSIVIQTALWSQPHIRQGEHEQPESRQAM